MSYCIETEALTYRYSGKETILDRIALHVPEGSIYGFLGPNGAGKTTTLKLLLGLLKKQQGSIRVFGQELADNRIDILRRTGSLIETPSLYAQLTARENLEVFRKIYNVPKHRIEDVLELVGLNYTGKKKAGAFSLGMKQRLSIAIALLHRPSLLILDEPTNGLDPNGILEMRNLLRQLNSDHNITILVSSHLLSEIEKLVTHVGIISNGKMTFEGSLPELLRKQRSSALLTIEVSDVVAAWNASNSLGFPASISNGVLVLSGLSREQVAQLNKQLVQHSVDVYAITTSDHDLESVFMHLTNA
jgi:lantibiotic transport system ATP-binding protein